MSAASPSDPAWWREAVVYQIYPRSFADSNGDGVGDLAGITGKLDHLAHLGVDALWLSPIFRSPMADFGYDVADYCAVDPVFGTLDDLDELVAGLHARGMRLLLDWVPNHSSDQHPWFVESRSSRTSPKRSWYVWREAGPDGGPPNNWMSVFKGVPAWTHDEATDQWYLHMFLAEQPDLNWANPEVEAAMHDTLRFWLDRGVDGFRSDVVHLIGKGDTIEPLDGSPRSPILEIDTPDGHARLRRIRHLLDGYPHAPMMVGEVYLLAEGQSASYLGTPDEPELHLSFDFRPIHTEWGAESIAPLIDRMQAEFAEPAWPTWVWSNHDHPRHRTRHGSEARARVAALLGLTVRGTPFLYAGEELGLTDAEVPADRVVDPHDRDGCRAPIPWTADGDAERGHGWHVDPAVAPSGRPWLPFPANASTHAADVQVGAPGSMFEWYRELLALRRATPALRRGAMSPVRRDGDVVSFDRAHDGDVVTVVANLGDAPADPPPGVVDATALAATHATSAGGVLAGGRLAPCEAVVFRRP